METAASSARAEAHVPDWGDRTTPTDFVRAEDVLDIALGHIVQDAKGANWVFIGWRTNTAGRIAHFHREVSGWHPHPFPEYHASSIDALCRKFPGLAALRTDQAASGSGETG